MVAPVIILTDRDQTGGELVRVGKHRHPLFTDFSCLCPLSLTLSLSLSLSHTYMRIQNPAEPLASHSVHQSNYETTRGS